MSRRQYATGKKEDMDIEIDHYVFLGLPTGEEGSKLSEKEITKAYRQKALELHPDKRPDDPNAPANFQKLQTSYQILKDEKARKLFDDLLRAKQQKSKRQSQHDFERRRKMSDLEERERHSFYQDPTAKTKNEEDSIARQLREEISRIREMYNKMGFNETGEPSRKKQKVGGEKSGVRDTYTDTGMDTDKEKTLKVSWEKGGLEYSVERLRGLFETFGEVKDVMIRKKKGSAFVIMATKEAAGIDRTGKHLEEIGILRSAITRMNDTNDGCDSDFAIDGEFRVCLLRNRIERAYHRTADGYFHWSKVIPYKVSCFVWRAKMGRIPVYTELIKRGVDCGVETCGSCIDGVETADHLLIGCPFALAIWKHVFGWCGIPINEVTSIQGLIDFTIRWGRGSKVEFKTLLAIVFGSLWCIWRSRNDRVFQVAATGTICGDLSNPLLVIPLQPSVAQAFEDSVLQKLQKAAERQK